jgi:hypothetical protein
VRKLALEWAEFQYRAKLMSKTRAEIEVATAFGIGQDSLKEWKDKIKKLFGSAVAKDGLKRVRGANRAADTVAVMCRALGRSATGYHARCEAYVHLWRHARRTLNAWGAPLASHDPLNRGRRLPSSIAVVFFAMLT